MTSELVQTLPVFRAADIIVVRGANLGDALSFAEELALDDVYALHPAAQVQTLTVQPGRDGMLLIAPDSPMGRAGHRVYLDAVLTMMTARGATVEFLVLVEVDQTRLVEAIYVLPLASLTPRVEYTLIGVDCSNARTRFAEMACVSFLRGTRVTLASGAQVPIETLQPGDMVLTRDDGPRPLRWIGNATARAVGEFAPIHIRAGALNNTGNLLVSPESRLFIYQRSDALGVGRSEVLVRARHLLNGDSITRQAGGFVDYYQLLFDEHQIIYVEGIAAETMLADPRMQYMLPAELGEALSHSQPDPDRRRLLDFEVQPHLVERPDAAELLRRASSR